jgi:preprotein translocase subunit SecY
MLTAFARAFRTPDLRKKLLFTLAIMALFRLGAHIPAPGVDTKALSTCLGLVKAAGSNNQALGLINLFSGGALLQLSIFALGIMPYITASIILQLLTVVIPRLEMLKKEGQAGQTKITQYTRYLTIGLAILQSTTMLTLVKNNPGALLGAQCTSSSGVINPKVDTIGMVVMVITMTAGTTLIMWLGELITDRGIGNGMSLLIFTSITANFPSSLWAIKQGSTTMNGWPVFFGVLLMGMLLVGAVVFVEQGQRRIPVQYAKRMVGRRMYGGTSTYLPLKVNQAGVIPVIFASSLLYLPQLLSQLNSNTTSAWQRFIQNYIVNQSSWAHILVYFALIVFFTYFYVSITFNPEERADDMKKYGGFIPGIRPGRPTAEYLSYVLNRVTFPGALYLGIIAVLPNFFLGVTGGGNNTANNFPFGGTAVLIMVGVGLDTV